MSNKNNIRPGKTIVFADGVERTIYPVTLRNMRKLMAAVKNLEVDESTTLDDDAINKMVEAAKIVFIGVDEDLANDPERIEDVVDIKSFNEMLSAAMGADPNV